MTYKFNKEKHIHELDGKPLMGTTSVIKEILPPPLAWYGAAKSLEPIGWTNSREVEKQKGIEIAGNSLEEIKQLNPTEYYDLLQKCYHNHDEFKKEKGDYGDRVHAKIEKISKLFIKVNNGKVMDALVARSDDEDEKRAILQFLDWAKGKEFLYSEVHTYSEKLWLGGIIDLVYKEDGRYYIGDIKTSKDIYPSHFIQMGMYDYQQAESGYFTPQGRKIGEPIKFHGYTVINLPKGEEIKVRSYYMVDEMREFAENLVSLYNRKNKLEKYLNGE